MPPSILSLVWSITYTHFLMLNIYWVSTVGDVLKTEKTQTLPPRRWQMEQAGYWNTSGKRCYFTESRNVKMTGRGGAIVSAHRHNWITRCLGGNWRGFCLTDSIFSMKQKMRSFLESHSRLKDKRRVIKAWNGCQSDRDRQLLRRMRTNSR